MASTTNGRGYRVPCAFLLRRIVSVTLVMHKYLSLDNVSISVSYYRL
jgi:hypothetical protein